MSTLGQRLREERERLGLTQIDFAALGGAKKHSQINYEADRTAPDTNYLSALGEHGVDIIYLLTGERGGVRHLPGGGIEIKDAAAELLKHGLRAASPTMAEIRAQLSAEAEDRDTQVTLAEFAAVPFYDVSMAAGSGFMNDTEAVIAHLSFRRDWLKRMGAFLPALILGRASGPSMEPTIWDRDPVLLDTSKREVPIFIPARRKKGPVFSFLQDGEARIKRILRFKSGPVMLVSDNPEFPPEPVDLHQLQIVGRALWWSHTDLE